MGTPFKHFEKHFHRVVVQTVLVDDYSCWFFRLSLILKVIYLALLRRGRKYWFSEDWVQFYTEHSTQHVSIVVKLTDRLEIFHIHTISIDGIAFFILPDVWWSYLNFFRHFNILFVFVHTRGVLGFWGQGLIRRLIFAFAQKYRPEILEQIDQRKRIIDPKSIRFSYRPTSKPYISYFRILSNEYLIEYDNQGGNHIHAAWRDFDGDFGRDLIKEHLKKENHR